MCANAGPYWNAVNARFVVKEMESAERELEEAEENGLDITQWYLRITSADFPFRERSGLERLTGSQDWWYMHNREAPTSYLERMLTSAEIYTENDKIYLVRSDVALILSIGELSQMVERREVLFFDASRHYVPSYYPVQIHDVKGEVEVRTKKERIIYLGWMPSDELPSTAEKYKRNKRHYVMLR